MRPRKHSPNHIREKRIPKLKPPCIPSTKIRKRSIGIKSFSSIVDHKFTVLESGFERPLLKSASRKCQDGTAPNWLRIRTIGPNFRFRDTGKGDVKDLQLALRELNQQLRDR
eukprot:1159662-Pelagomonas_calceolata.AAC.1